MSLLTHQDHADTVRPDGAVISVACSTLHLSSNGVFRPLLGLRTLFRSYETLMKTYRTSGKLLYFVSMT